MDTDNTKDPPGQDAGGLILLADKKPPERIKVLFLDNMVAFPLLPLGITIQWSAFAEALINDRFALIVHHF